MNDSPVDAGCDFHDQRVRRLVPHSLNSLGKPCKRCEHLFITALDDDSGAGRIAAVMARRGRLKATPRSHA